MRMNSRITFVTETDGGFNPVTGKHDEPMLSKLTKACNLSTLSIERSKVLFGEVDANIRVARLQHPYKGVFDYVNINDKKYKVTRQSDYRKGVFYLEGAN